MTYSDKFGSGKTASASKRSTPWRLKTLVRLRSVASPDQEWTMKSTRYIDIDPVRAPRTRPWACP